MSSSPPRTVTSAQTLGVLVLSLCVSAAALVGPDLVMPVAALGGLLLAQGWPRLLNLPSPVGVTAVLSASAVGVAVAAWVGDRTDLRWVSVVTAVTLIVSFLHQLLRRDGRERLVDTVSGTALGAGLLAGGAGYVAAAHHADGAALLAICTAAITVTTVVDLMAARGRLGEWALPVSMLAGAAIGLGVGALCDVRLVVAFCLGVAAAGVSHAVRLVVTRPAADSSASAQLAVAGAVLGTCGLLPYVASWVLTR